MLNYCPTEFFILTDDEWNTYQEKQQAYGGRSTYADQGQGADVLIDCEESEADDVLYLLGSEVTRSLGVRVTWDTLTPAEDHALRQLQHDDRLTCHVRRGLQEAFVVLNPCYEVELVRAVLERTDVIMCRDQEAETVEQAGEGRSLW